MGLYEFEENTEAVETESAFSGDEIAEIIEESSESSDEEMYVEDGPAFDDDSKDLKKKKRRKKKAIAVVKEVVSFVVIILAAFVVAILINIYVIRTSNISGTSMYPTLQHGQRVLISRLPYVFSEPEHGDIIVFDASKEKRTFIRDVSEALRDNAVTKLFVKEQTPVDEEEFYIKRIVGVAGDVITVKDYVMYINGKPIENKGYSINDDGTAYYTYEGMSWTVEDGYVFVMGDNRINSKDSRMIGCVPIDCIMGKVVKQ